MDRFHDRRDAGRRLGDQLQTYRDNDALVLGLPRGGVTVAEQIALALVCDLDIIVSRKLRTPGQPELAIGALAEGGVATWNVEFITEFGLTRGQREKELSRVRKELEHLSAAYRSELERAPIGGRVVILTDDGVATGATLRAAIVAVAAQNPSKLIVALPGGPRDTLAEISHMPSIHEVIALVAPEHLGAVGQLYDVFDQVNAEQMQAMLRNAARRRRATGARGLRHPSHE